jgi:EAL domain-containing protein (putative c-di-GMP-specific phosphodiesterase class I)
MGISIFPKNGEDYETLLKKADVAKCCAMEDGANRFRFFTDEMNQEIQARLKMESGLRQALARKELYLEYQPQVDIRTGAVAGLEALLRWNSPELGRVPPGRFIGVAENSSLIIPIGEWVLRSACTQAKSWQERGLPAVPVAVNVSPVQFRQQGFCELVRKTLRETGLKPEYLELELTESLLLTNADLTASMMAELRAMGVTLTIDDFGTGYSSLGYLNQFKVHRLKIAQAFVKDVSTDPDDAAITIAIIKMAKAMNLSVLAEGVETEEQLLFMRAQNCPMIQGFYFSRPVAVDEVDGHLRTGFGRLLPVAAA